MKKTFNLKGYALASIAAAVLAACGGGGGSSSTPAAAVTAVSVPATTVALPTPTASTPATAATAGTLETMGFVSALTNAQVDVPITGSGTTSVMTFPSPAFTVTGATSSSTTFNTGGGLVKADGNVVLYCANGKTTPAVPTNNATDLTFQVAGKVFISANLVAVSDASVLAGLTIKTEDCAGQVVNTTYNADGTSSRVDSSGTTALDVTKTAAFVSAAGFTGPGGSNYKTRIYKYVTGGTTRYFVVTLINQVSPNGTYVNVGYQNP